MDGLSGIYLGFSLRSFSPAFIIQSFKGQPFRGRGFLEGKGSAASRPSISIHIGAVVLGSQTQWRSEEGDKVL